VSGVPESCPSLEVHLQRQPRPWIFIPGEKPSVHCFSNISSKIIMNRINELKTKKGDFAEIVF
jgi:hypothetical protein